MPESCFAARRCRAADAGWSKRLIRANPREPYAGRGPQPIGQLPGVMLEMANVIKLLDAFLEAVPEGGCRGARRRS
jgi:hypothetical protein